MAPSQGGRKVIREQAPDIELHSVWTHNSDLLPLPPDCCFHVSSRALTQQPVSRAKATVLHALNVGVQSTPPSPRRTFTGDGHKGAKGLGKGQEGPSLLLPKEG